MKTTLNAIRSLGPCESGWKRLLKGLGKATADDEPLSLVTIIEINGFDDALWCLRAVSGHDKEIRLFAVWCARQVQHLMTDKRSVSAIDVAERFANGDATKEELDAARAAACGAARAAASDAASAAAWDAAWDAASAAARDAAWDAASAAACVAAWAAACVAAWAAASAAARDAAWDAASAAARDAAWDAASAAASAAQESKFRELANATQEES